VLMSYQEYERLRRARSLGAYERFSQRLGREIERQGMSQEQLLAELREDRREVFEEQYGRATQD